MLTGVDHTRLVRYIAKIVGAQDAEDVVQDTYVKALSAEPPHTNRTAWALAIARNAAFDHLRMRGRRPQDHTPLYVDPSLDETLHLEDSTDIHEILEVRDRVAQGLQGIRPDWARAVVAFAKHGNLTDAATELGITISALKGRLNRGRKALNCAPLPEERMNLLAFVVLELRQAIGGVLAVSGLVVVAIGDLLVDAGCVIGGVERPVEGPADDDDFSDPYC